MSAPNATPTLHDPLETLSVQPLYQSASFSLFDVCCRPHDFRRGAEEWSRTHQIVFPRRGVFECEVGGQKLVVDPNRVLFFNRDEGYRVAHPARCGDECTVLTFADGVLQAALEEVDPARLEREAPRFRFSHAAAAPRAVALQAALQHACRSDLASSAGVPDPLAFEEAALLLLQGLLRDAYRQRCTDAPRPSRPATERLQRQQIERAQLLLAARFAEPLSVADISKAAFCSPFHLARIFRRHTGMSLHQYRQRLRLREALRRLAEGEEELSRLALDLGFASHSHFTDVFRQAFGLPPSACREQRGARWLTRAVAQGTRMHSYGAPWPGPASRPASLPVAWAGLASLRQSLGRLHSAGTTKAEARPVPQPGDSSP